MKLILTRKEHLEAVRCGLKRQTLRFWRKDRKFQKNELVLLSNYKERVVVRVIECYKKPLSNINLAEAVANGHTSIESLQNAVRKIYGTQNFLATVIKYEFVT